MSIVNPTPPHNRPVWSFAALLVFVASLTGLYLAGKDSGAALYIALVVANLPTLVAAIASEQAARDIRNGTVSRKAKEGAMQAIDESGVMLRDGPVANAQLAALNATLTQVHELAKVTRDKVTNLEEQA